jgi:hypothetical protein
MDGTFNGVQLRGITSRKTSILPCGGMILTFRVAGKVPASLDDALRLHGPALLILTDEILEGRIVHFTADVLYGYQITLEIPLPRRTLAVA